MTTFKLVRFSEKWALKFDRYTVHEGRTSGIAGWVFRGEDGKWVAQGASKQKSDCTSKKNAKEWVQNFWLRDRGL